VTDYENRSIAAMEAASGKEAPDLWRPLVGLARAKLATGKSADAKALLQRAIAIAEKAQVGVAEIEPAKKLLEGIK